MKGDRVIIESPYAANESLGITRQGNIEYAEKCIKHSLSLGEIPFASHLFYTQFLDDNIPEERERGIECGYEWMQFANAVIFYTDHGMSVGMIKAEQMADKFGIQIIYRNFKKG